MRKPKALFRCGSRERSRREEAYGLTLDLARPPIEAGQQPKASATRLGPLMQGVTELTTPRVVKSRRASPRRLQ